MNDRWARLRNLTLRTAVAGGIICLLTGIASTQTGDRKHITSEDQPEAQFHLVRVAYRSGGGFRNFYWAIDYPDAEMHFMPALRRLTNLEVADDSRHLGLMDDRIFSYPFLFMQQPGQGYWEPTSQEAERLREYLARGGFLLVDDFHGEYQWAVFQAAMERVLPDRQIVEIPDSDPLMHVFYDLGDRVQIPGLRHLRRARGGRIVAQMEGPPSWRGIYDDRGRLVVAMNFNIDMGDAWEHADDAYYPIEMTHQAYRLGVNYVIYAMTH
jgi:hypothetical protein